jgi:hypothetical protein
MRDDNVNPYGYLLLNINVNAIVNSRNERLAMADISFPPFPRVVRPVPNPLALYLRPGRNDHVELSKFVASGDAACSGAVFDATLCERHAELRTQIVEHRLDAILDPKTQPAATIGGYTDAIGRLPWGLPRPHIHTDFEGVSGRRLISALGDFVIEKGFTEVVAPTHLLTKPDDPWLQIDIEATKLLRSHLDRNSAGKVPIIYSLAVSGALFRDGEQRRRLIEAIFAAPIAEVWIKVDGFGASSSATAAKTYIKASTEFHKLGVPVVADYVGGAIGLSLLAFGAVGGMAHGITLGERFSSNGWWRTRMESSFGAHRRVYVPAIDAMLKPNEAKALIEVSARARALFACNDTNCCPRGVRDMIENPARHFLYQRIKEVSGLGGIPEQLRPQRFLDQHLRATSDKALAAATINWEDDAMAKKMQENRKRLDSLRIALGEHAENNPPKSFAQLPLTRAAREGR